MYLIVSSLCAVVSLVLSAAVKSRRFRELFLVYVAASLMWAVDAVVAWQSGESAFTFEAEDVIISAITVFGGIAFWALFYVLVPSLKSKKAVSYSK